MPLKASSLLIVIVHKTWLFIVLKMLKFIPGEDVLRRSLLTFHLKKMVAESYRLLIEANGEHDLIKNTCERWFKCSKKGDFGVKDKDFPNQPKKCEYVDLQALLNEDLT